MPWKPQTLKVQSHLVSTQNGTSCSSHVRYAATTPGTLARSEAPLATPKLQLTSVFSVSRGRSPEDSSLESGGSGEKWAQCL